MKFTTEQVWRILDLRKRHINSGMGPREVDMSMFTFLGEHCISGHIEKFHYSMRSFLDILCDMNTKWYSEHVEFEVAGKNGYVIKCDNKWVMKLCNDIQKALNEYERDDFQSMYS